MRMEKQFHFTHILRTEKTERPLLCEFLRCLPAVAGGVSGPVGSGPVLVCTVCCVLAQVLILSCFTGPLSAELRFHFSALLVASVLPSIDSHYLVLPSPGKVSFSPLQQPCQQRMEYSGEMWQTAPPVGMGSARVGGGPGVVGLLKYLGMRVRRAGSQPVSWLLQDTRWSGPHSFF